MFMLSKSAYQINILAFFNVPIFSALEQKRLQMTIFDV